MFFKNLFLPRGLCCSPFPISSNLCPLEQSKQLTLLTHETFAPATTAAAVAALPRQTHTTLLRRASSQPWGVPGRARSTFCDGPGPTPPRRATNRPGVPGRARSILTRIMPGFVTAVGGVRPGPVGLTDPSSVTDRRNEFIYMIHVITCNCFCYILSIALTLRSIWKLSLSKYMGTPWLWIWIRGVIIDPPPFALHPLMLFGGC